MRSESDSNTPTMNTLGEKAFLRALLPSLPSDSSFVNGFGHDASIVDVGLEQNIAFKIDRAAHPVLRGQNPEWFKAWGRLAVVANVSDLLAVGATPKAFMLSIIVPGTYPAADVADIVAGCQSACEVSNVAFVGGDTKEGVEAQVVGSALGVIARGRAFGRHRAHPGDKLVIAGMVGGFMAAYAMLRSTAGNVDSARREQLLHYVSTPQAQNWIVKAMPALGLALAACDLSDGLADAIDIFCGEEVGISIDAQALPLHPLAAEASATLQMDAVNMAFGVGDWAIAYVIPGHLVAQFRSVCPPGFPIQIVGEFSTDRRRVIAAADGTVRPTPTTINEHFRDRLEDESSDYAQSLMVK